MSADNSCRLLFVYGTLRCDSAQPMARYLASMARFLGRASAAGRLYDLGPYPGMTAAQGPAERVWGHLLELADPAATLERLDLYEDCPFGEPIPSLFQRHKLPVVGADGQTHTAWVYTYHGEVREQRRLPSGEYVPR
jgi:gamma-glutamylcyclotransferase (GGCT)/AIG2-like uncharacterized protein YtfP